MSARTTVRRRTEECFRRRRQVLARTEEDGVYLRMALVRIWESRGPDDESGGSTAVIESGELSKRGGQLESMRMVSKG